ncbi:MAG: hypothetical protein HRU28_16995, partial [Rhizobiales bacterium]|nr:hypothetical protein [Hyphomicrobiales bacterium]
TVVQNIYSGGIFKTPKTVQKEMIDLNAPLADNVFPFRITFDIESFLIPETTQAGDKTQVLNTHKLASIAVASNVPGFETPQWFMNDISQQITVNCFLEYITQISKASFKILKERNAHCITAVNNAIKKFNCQTKELVKKQKKIANPFVFMKSKLMDYLQEIPVISFNGGAYDLNVIKSEFFQYFINDGKLTDTVEDMDVGFSDLQEGDGEFVEMDIDDSVEVMETDDDNNEDESAEAHSKKTKKEPKAIKFVVKRNNNFMCIKTQNFIFLDITNYLAPGVSLAKYFAAYNAEEVKGIFPYDWLTDLAKLSQTSLPPPSAFYNSLKGKSISDEEYAICKDVWTRNNMSTMKDYLKYYNLGDVVPFLKCLDVHSAFFASKGIDMFKDGISISGLTLNYLMTCIPKTKPCIFSLPNKANADLLHLMKDNIVGGPAIVFHRLHISDETFIRKNPEKICKKIIGYDSNALYLWAISQPMPSGFPVRRLSEHQFRPQYQNKYGHTAYAWLTFIEQRDNIRLHHKFNADGEKQIGPNKIPVDGYNPKTNTVYNFHGCYWHSHNCYLTDKTTLTENQKQDFEDRRRKTAEVREYLLACNVKLVEIYECEWYRLVQDDPEAARISRLSRYTDYNKLRGSGINGQVEEADILKAVLNNTFFGLVECDIHVPDSLRQSKFAEFPPIFKNTLVDRSHISPLMREYAEKHDALKKPTRMLISSFSGEKVVLTTPLLKWYLENGLKVTKIYQITHYDPQACFISFETEVTEARRLGDVDPTKAVIGNAMKLLGN